MSALFHTRYGEGRLLLKSGVKNLLQYLKAQDKKSTLASSARLGLVRRELSDAGLLHYFDVVIGDDMVEASDEMRKLCCRICLLYRNTWSTKYDQLQQS